MKITPLKIVGAWEFTPRQFDDARGTFFEAFKNDALQELGVPFVLSQVNMSSSVPFALRGIHFADVPPGQAKYVFCPQGAIMDVVVDIRTGSPTFGSWDFSILDAKNRRAVFISEGLGHAFLSLSEGATVAYLTSSRYDTSYEHGINPFDGTIDVDWSQSGLQIDPRDLVVSDKDLAAPSLIELKDAGCLPSFST